MGRYQGNFAGLGVYAILGYSGSGHVNAPTTLGSAFNGSYNGFSVGDGGLALTYAGFTIGGNVLWGAFNNQVQLKPTGAPNAVAWVGGAQYAIGPVTVAASYYNYQYQGSTATIINGKSLTQRYDDALAVGATYSIAPGLNAYAEYLYGQSHQGAVNLLGVGSSNEHNDVHVQSFILGTRVQW
jgi:predicted porin